MITKIIPQSLRIYLLYWTFPIFFTRHYSLPSFNLLGKVNFNNFFHKFKINNKGVINVCLKEMMIDQIA